MKNRHSTPPLTQSYLVAPPDECPVGAFLHGALLPGVLVPEKGKKRQQYPIQFILLEPTHKTILSWGPPPARPSIRSGASPLMPVL